MQLETWTTVLIALVPAISAAGTVICGLIALLRSIKTMKKDNQNSVGKSQERIERLEKKLNIANQKLTSIEKLLDENNKRK